MTRGVRQGCPLSPLLYMLYVARMEERLIRSGLGFLLQNMEEEENVKWVLPGLTFADDIVLTGGSVETMQQLLDICADEAAVLGLQYNTTKSAVVQFAGSEKMRVESLKLGVDDIKVLNMYRCLGVTLSNEVDYHTHLRLAAMRGASILRKRSLWSCNRFIMSRELWKGVVVPGLTFVNAVVCVPGELRAVFERRER